MHKNNESIVERRTINQKNPKDDDVNYQLSIQSSACLLPSDNLV
jgi:hypothetical protein